MARSKTSAAIAVLTIAIATAAMSVGPWTSTAHACQRVVASTIGTSAIEQGVLPMVGTAEGPVRTELVGVRRVSYVPGAPAQNGRTSSSIEIVEEFWGPYPEEMVEPRLIGGIDDDGCSIRGPQSDTDVYLVDVEPEVPAALRLIFADRAEAHDALAAVLGPSTVVERDEVRIDELVQEAQDRANAWRGDRIVPVAALAMIVGGFLAYLLWPRLRPEGFAGSSTTASST